MEHTPVSSPTPVTSGVIVQQQSCAQVDDGSVSGISLLGGGPASSVGGSLSDSNLSSTTATIAAVGIPPGAIPVTPIHQKPKITSSAAGSTTATPVKGGGCLGVVQPLTTAAATSCVPSPVLSPPRKIWGRNKNNTSEYWIFVYFANPWFGRPNSFLYDQCFPKIIRNLENISNRLNILSIGSTSLLYNTI